MLAAAQCEPSPTPPRGVPLGGGGRWPRSLAAHWTRPAPSRKTFAAFVPHQANMRIIDEFAKQLKLPETVIVARDIEDTGNTSAASIPLATHRLLAEHPTSGGLAQIGFGAGLVFGAQVVVLP